MRTPVSDYLGEVHESLIDNRSGQVADYIPELAAADPDRFALGLVTTNGEYYGAGDVDAEFSIQSISKPFAYAASLASQGFEQVLAKVGVEPSGEAFNELSLEGGTHRPMNPMINAGALTAHFLLGPDCSADERFARVHEFFSELAGHDLRIDDAVCRSELDSAHRNLSIAYMLRNYGIITGDPAAVVEGYTRQCALLVSVRDLAMMGATLANSGAHPVTGQQIVRSDVTRQVLSVMLGCGMYDAAGDWLTSVGIPAKSGVSGGLMGALPGQVGVATFSPRLDSHGNSVRGVRACERLSVDMGLHLMESEGLADSPIRSVTTAAAGSGAGATLLVEVQGSIQFSGAEQLLRTLQDATEQHESGEPPAVVHFDLTRVNRFSDVGRRMVLEAMRRLMLDGIRVTLGDPENSLPDPDVGDGRHPEPVDRR